MKFRSKPVEIEAMQFTDESKDLCWVFVTCNKYGSFEYNEKFKRDTPVLIIQTLEGEMKVRIGDWIIKGTVGEFYPCKNEVFRRKYEPMEQMPVDIVLDVEEA